MAAFRTNVVFRNVGSACTLTPPSITGRLHPSPSPPHRCPCAQFFPRRPLSTISVRECRGPRRRRFRYRQSRQPHSPSFCFPTDVSASASTELNELNVDEGNQSGMSVEEKNGILAFMGGDNSEEERNSNENADLSSSSKEKEEEGVDIQDEDEEDEDEKALQAMKKREQEVAELQRRASRAAKGQGAAAAKIVALFMNLLDRPSPGDGRMVAGAGSAVLERVEEEVASLQAVEGVDGQVLFEILRLVKLLQMDVQLIAAARKDSTLSERLVQAKTHCRQFLNILSML
ncbi:unnamed protein product [Calypogeia fissa]